MIHVGVDAFDVSFAGSLWWVLFIFFYIHPKYEGKKTCFPFPSLSSFFFHSWSHKHSQISGSLSWAEFVPKKTVINCSSIVMDLLIMCHVKDNTCTDEPTCLDSPLQFYSVFLKLIVFSVSARNSIVVVRSYCFLAAADCFRRQNLQKPRRTERRTQDGKKLSATRETDIFI